MNQEDNDRRAVELGVKFRSDTDGFVAGVRFWKGPRNTGIHTGDLWSLSGTRLASAVFTNESASGWQEVRFAQPVPVKAGVTYVASYHTPTGLYAQDAGAFAAAGVDSAPLHALRDGLDGPNGVYAYGTAGTFPTKSWRSSNNWVDVVFTTTP
ncbi:protein of unknown function [Raineyella antarctica]|uniref:DUF4082 domain-containing protein n=1 Tax=Raineyella antarctica TaxID=1577474 RepID=A0A1G6H8V7_9ACTN|nr:protein of unknown function [Raineyella antarctica]